MDLMDSHQPLISVVMSVFNGEKYLPYAIESILNQTYRDFEFLIINNGSNDKTRDIILSYGDPRIKLVDNATNLGLSKALNKGCKLARGKYIARLDADDTAHPTRFKKQINFLEKNEDVAVLGTDYTLIDGLDNVIKNVSLPISDEGIFFKICFTSSPLCHSSVIINKNVLQSLNYYPEDYDYCQDYALWINMLKKGYKISNLNEHLVNLRLHESNSTGLYFVEKHFTEIVKAYKIVIQDMLKIDMSISEIESLYKLYYVINSVEDNDLDMIIVNLNEIVNVLKTRTNIFTVFKRVSFCLYSFNRYYRRQMKIDTSYLSNYMDCIKMVKVLLKLLKMQMRIG